MSDDGARRASTHVMPQVLGQSEVDDGGVARSACSRRRRITHDALDRDRFRRCWWQQRPCVGPARTARLRGLGPSAPRRAAGGPGTTEAIFLASLATSPLPATKTSRSPAPLWSWRLTSDAATAIRAPAPSDDRLVDDVHRMQRAGHLDDRRPSPPSRRVREGCRRTIDKTAVEGAEMMRAGGGMKMGANRRGRRRRWRRRRRGCRRSGGPS